MTERLLTNLADSWVLARSIAALLRPGDTLLLSGDLGAGKTTLTQMLIAALSAGDVEVTSPTFTLVQTYPVTLANGVQTELYHYDLYRVEKPSALQEIELEEAEPFIRVIEWPERAGTALQPRSWLHLALTLQGDTRVARMQAGGAMAQRFESMAA